MSSLLLGYPFKTSRQGLSMGSCNCCLHVVSLTKLLWPQYPVPSLWGWSCMSDSPFATCSLPSFASHDLYLAVLRFVFWRKFLGLNCLLVEGCGRLELSNPVYGTCYTWLSCIEMLRGCGLSATWKLLWCCLCNCIGCCCCLQCKFVILLYFLNISGCCFHPLYEFECLL